LADPEDELACASVPVNDLSENESGFIHPGSDDLFGPIEELTGLKIVVKRSLLAHAPDCETLALYHESLSRPDQRTESLDSSMHAITIGGNVVCLSAGPSTSV
jgi:hypothetical protein